MPRLAVSIFVAAIVLGGGGSAATAEETIKAAAGQASAAIVRTMVAGDDRPWEALPAGRYYVERREHVTTLNDWMRRGADDAEAALLTDKPEATKAEIIKARTIAEVRGAEAHFLAGPTYTIAHELADLHALYGDMDRACDFEAIAFGLAVLAKTSSSYDSAADREQAARDGTFARASDLFLREREADRSAGD